MLWLADSPMFQLMALKIYKYYTLKMEQPILSERQTSFYNAGHHKYLKENSLGVSNISEFVYLETTVIKANQVHDSNIRIDSENICYY
jgi:hypothetical protein